MSEIVAVIPTYNSAETIADRVEELLHSSFKKIVICDDNSQDNTVRMLAERFGTAIEVIAGTKNLGPGGNRNRVISTSIIADSDLLFFLDADCKVICDVDLALCIQAAFIIENVGVVGFGINNNDGTPMKWNFGELMHPVHEAAGRRLASMLQQGIITEEQFKIGAPALAASYRMTDEPESSEVGWVAEGCFAIRSHLFKKIGGFASNMRYHETHDLNARIQAAGFKTMFNSLPVARHLSYDSRMDRRQDDERSGRLYYYQTHWGMTESTFSHLFD